MKQTDYGGNFKYSSIIKIKYTTGQDNTIKITPNPFSNLTTISFSIPQSQKISIQVYDMEGRLVKTVANNEMPAGVHQITWNATNGNGSAVANGLYILILKTGEDTETKKVSVIR